MRSTGIFHLAGMYLLYALVFNNDISLFPTLPQSIMYY